MIIDEFVWLPEIVDKLLDRHDVSPEEIVSARDMDASERRRYERK